jgi:two-component system, cell cycle response regulator DivK
MNSIHALIIDDNSKNLGVLAQLLTLQGARATRVNNPLHLTETLATLEKVDIVFLDLEMPGLNGYEVLKMLRAVPHFARVPIVAYTVHLSEVFTAQEKGFDGFIGKPVDSDRFPEQMERILKGESVWDAR